MFRWIENRFINQAVGVLLRHSVRDDPLPDGRDRYEFPINETGAPLARNFGALLFRKRLCKLHKIPC